MGAFRSAALSRAACLVKGDDAAAFVHRMSTQHVESLASGEARLNALTNDKGRMVDLVHHLVTDEGVLLLGHTGDSQALASWLDGFVFTEDVELEEREVQTFLVTDQQPTALWSAFSEGASMWIRTFDHVIDGELCPVWLSTGEPTGALLDDKAWEAARIAAGVPAAPGEICDRYNPLELALHDAIHWAKGCYIGQEVIARVDNYGKQARHLVGLKSAALLAVGAKVLRDGKEIGQVTSSAAPREDAWPNALAVVKLKEDLDGVEVSIDDEPATTLSRAAAQQPHD